MSDNEQVLHDLFKDSTPKNSNKDEIICIIDRSGSMDKIRSDAEGGFNAFITEQKKVEGAGANVTIVEFDNTTATICERIDIQDVESYVLKPRFGTALYDAIGMTINGSDYTGEGKVIVVIVTDGDENASQEYSQESVFKLISERKEQGWEFLFLAANQDAMTTGMGLGMDANTSINFNATSKGMADAYQVGATYTSSLRTKSKADALIDMQTAIDKTDGDVS